MKSIIIFLLFMVEYNSLMNAQSPAGQYASVNNLKMYYEIHGNGYPLVLIHGGGSTIVSTYASILPELSTFYKVIAVELQAHGHTPDINRPLSFEQDADDVAGLLVQLGIHKADFMGFSNGGTTCLQIAIRHPELVNKLVLASAAFKRDGMQEGLWDGLKQATLANMPQPLKDAYLKANPDTAGLRKMFNRDVARMLSFKNIPVEKIKNIQAPALIINGDRDVIRNEHALELFNTLPHARLAILPGEHGAYIGEITTQKDGSKIPMLVTEMIIEFLKAGP